MTKATNDRSEAITERPKGSGEYLAVRRSSPPRLSGRVGTTYQTKAESDLFRLCAAFGQEMHFETYLEAQRALFAGWGNRGIPLAQPQSSGITDDHSPYAFVLDFGPGGGELRQLVEAQSHDASESSMRAAALDLNRELAKRFNPDFTSFAAVREILLDGTDAPPCSVWHGVRWAPEGKTRFELVFDQSAGAGRTATLVREALARLRFGTHTELCLELLLRRPNDNVRRLSLDLSNGPEARVTVAVEHYGVSAEELEHMAVMSPFHVPGDITAFSTSLLGSAGPFLSPVMTSVSFVVDATTPAAVAVHLPIAHYAASDASVVQSVTKLLQTHGLDDVSYRRAVHVFAPRALEAGAGLQSHVTFRREAGGAHVSVWLSPELFAREP